MFWPLSVFETLSEAAFNAAAKPVRKMLPSVVAEEDDVSRPKGKEARHAQSRLRQEKNRLLSPLKKKNIEIEGEIASLEARKAEMEHRPWQVFGSMRI
ncbi:MAG: hypothetical protein ACUVQV_03740 [Dissulfurimicrobium sp.]|uniref:hypothetical protein n=1 Tax=Dissulfurimicrobium sp. TaxID=2022436 RepID=UPI00404B6D6A